MSDSFAALRKGVGHDLHDLAQQHYRHDLEQADRDRLKGAANQVSRYAMVGSLVGIGLGAALAVRLRQNRAAYFNAFRAMERPESVVFAGGRTEKIPDITPLLKPTTVGDVATYTFLSIAGVFFGGEVGLLIGSASASRTITRDPESRARIEEAFRRFKAEALRKQADELDVAGPGGGKGKGEGILFG